MTCDERNEIDKLNAEVEQLNNKLERIRELHSPATPPEGKVWLGARGNGDQVPCEGCATGDPYLDEPWPCDTRKICDE